MGLGRRIHRVRDDDRDRARREIRARISAIPDARLIDLFDFEGAKNAPPPEAFGLTWPVIWTALGNPRVMDPEGNMVAGFGEEEYDALTRNMDRLVQPLRDRLEVIRHRRRNQ
jgi:hypothetical protein